MTRSPETPKRGSQVTGTGSRKPDRAKEDRHFVTVLARGLQVLQCFKSGEERLGNQDLAERCKLPKSTITRLTYTLTKLGFLHNESGSGRYRLGMTTLTLGGTTLSRLDAKEVSRPLMQELASNTGSLVALGMRDGMSMLYIETARSDSFVTIRLGLLHFLELRRTGAFNSGSGWRTGSSLLSRSLQFHQRAPHSGSGFPQRQTRRC